MNWFRDYESAIASIHDYSYQYEILKLLHQELPELRFGQVFSDFFDWLKKQGKDPYYMEDSRMYFYFKEYINSIKGRE